VKRTEGLKDCEGKKLDEVNGTAMGRKRRVKGKFPAALKLRAPKRKADYPEGGGFKLRPVKNKGLMGLSQQPNGGEKTQWGNTFAVVETGPKRDGAWAWITHREEKDLPGPFGGHGRFLAAPRKRSESKKNLRPPARNLRKHRQGERERSLCQKKKKSVGKGRRREV